MNTRTFNLIACRTLSVIFVIMGLIVGGKDPVLCLMFGVGSGLMWNYVCP